MIEALRRVYDRIPTAINPLRTRTPTTGLGQLGRAVNPLNPVNAATMLLEAAIGETVGRTLGDDARRQAEYFSFGLKPGLVLSVLDAGPAGATDEYIQQRMAENQRAYEAERAARLATQAATSTESAVAPASTSPGSGGVGAPRSAGGASVSATEPRVGPRPQARPTVGAAVSPASTPRRETAAAPNELATTYMKQEMLGRALDKEGELRRRLWEAGGGAGLTRENFDQWVQANPALAYRDMLRREGRLQSADVGGV